MKLFNLCLMVFSFVSLQNSAQAQVTSADFTFQCNYDFSPMLKVVRTGNLLDVTAEGAVTENLIFLIHGLHDAQMNGDLAPLLGRDFTIHFVIPLEPTAEVSVGLNRGPYDQSTILRKVDSKLPRYTIATFFPITIQFITGEVNPLTFSFTNYGLDRLTVADPLPDSEDEVIRFILLGHGFDETVFQPRGCISQPIHLAP